MSNLTELNLIPVYPLKRINTPEFNYLLNSLNLETLESLKGVREDIKDFIPKLSNLTRLELMSSGLFISKKKTKRIEKLK